MYWILVAEDVERFIIPRLFDVTVCGQVLASRIARNKVLPRKETECSGVVPGREVYLG